MASSETTPTSRGRSQIQKGAIAVGAVFLLVGIAGFIPGITTHYSMLMVAGPMSDAKLLGLFQVSVLHNAVHLLFGVAGIVLSRTPLRARNFLLYGGLVYAVLFFYGLEITYSSPANIVPLNAADTVLHFVLAIGMIGLSFLLDRGPEWRQTLIDGKAVI